jgi:hypothetical protein
MWRTLWLLRRQTGAIGKLARFRPRLEVLEGRCLPSTLTVLNTADSGPGSLRGEIAAAASVDKIVFDPGLAGQTINLTSGELVINKSLDIEGLGGSPPPVRVSGYGSRAFDITNASTTVTLAHLLISGTAGQGGGIYDAGATVSLVQDFFASCSAVGVDADPNNPGSSAGDAQGGAIYEAGGTLTLTQCSLVGCDAFGGNGSLVFYAPFAPGGNAFGGGIYNAGGALILNGCFTNANQALGGNGTVGGTGAGGLIYDATGATVTISNSTIDGGAVGGFSPAGGSAAFGGAIYQAGGSLSVSGSTVVGAASGSTTAGGLLYLTNSNVSLVSTTLGSGGDIGAVSAKGGGIYMAGGVLSATNCTFASEVLVQEGGLAEGGALYIAAGTATIQNCSFDNDSAIGLNGGEGFGGAIYVAGDGSISISKNTDFVGDTASTAGNNIYFGP